jgi:hypothetical protein
MEKEIWKDIPEYEGLYQVSNVGNVKSLPRQWLCGFSGKREHNGKILKSPINNSGYKNVNLFKNNKGKNYRVHQLVAMAFLNHKICGYDLVIDHINDNKLDNRVENLQIVTARFNVKKTQDKYLSKFKGVSKRPNNKWQSTITINKKQIYLGTFNCELIAHLAYQEALKKYNLV